MYKRQPEEILNKLKKISTEAFEHQVEKLNGEYQQFKTMSKAEIMDKIYYEPYVLSFNELCDVAKMCIRDSYNDRLTYRTNHDSISVIYIADMF